MNYSEIDILRDKRVAILTLGCKVNSYESDAIRRQFEQAGAVITGFDEQADVYIVNTCSVTNIADRKSRQMLHRARQNNPDAVIAATGCYAQIGAGELIDNKAADIVVGNSHKTELLTEVCQALEKQTDINTEGAYCACNVTPMTREHHYEDMLIDSCEERTRAFVKIEDGCNQFCSYCIIPYARGRVRSRSEESIVEEIKGLAGRGFREVVLTGIHVSSYGLTDYEKTDEGIAFRYEPLLHLIDAVSKIDGIERIRLGSLEPRIICREFAGALAANPKFCPYFHLSLQSGSDSVLARMHRHYTAEEFLDRCEVLRAAFDRPSINTDVIVGFPGETDEEFAECVEFLKRVSFAKTHIFKYSRRRGTVADRMPKQLTEAEKHARSEVLMELDAKNHRAYMEQFANSAETVLFETVSKIEGRDYLTGLTTRYVQVAVPCDEDGQDFVNTVANVKISGFLNGEYLLGNID